MVRSEAYDDGGSEMKKIKMLNQFGVAALALGIVLWAGAFLNSARAQNVEDAVVSAQNSFGGIELASFHLKPKEKPKPKFDPTVQTPQLDSDGALIIPHTYTVIRNLTPEQMQKFKQIAGVLVNSNIHSLGEQSYDISLAGDDDFIYRVVIIGSLDPDANFHATMISFGKGQGKVGENCDMNFYTKDFRTGQILSDGNSPLHCDQNSLRDPGVQKTLKQVINFWMNQDLNHLKDRALHN